MDTGYRAVCPAPFALSLSSILVMKVTDFAYAYERINVL